MEQCVVGWALVSDLGLVGGEICRCGQCLFWPNFRELQNDLEKQKKHNKNQIFLLLKVEQCLPLRWTSSFRFSAVRFIIPCVGSSPFPRNTSSALFLLRPFSSLLVLELGLRTYIYCTRFGRTRSYSL